MKELKERKEQLRGETKLFSANRDYAPLVFLPIPSLLNVLMERIIADDASLFREMAAAVEATNKN